MSRRIYLVVADHITLARVTHRSFYGPFAWSEALGYSDHLAGSYVDEPMRIDGELAITTVCIETMTMPKGEW